MAYLTLREKMEKARKNKDNEAREKPEPKEKKLVPNVPGARQVESSIQSLKNFEKMGYKERLELSKKNPRLYKELVEKSMNGEA